MPSPLSDQRREAEPRVPPYIILVQGDMINVVTATIVMVKRYCRQPSVTFAAAYALGPAAKRGILNIVSSSARYGVSWAVCENGGSPRHEPATILCASIWRHIEKRRLSRHLS